VTSPIIGARTMAHLEDNLGATGWLLAPDQVARLEEVSRVELPYPYDFIDRTTPARQRA
jgi:aryl-alcohol dehydrogenase-like predicted oxidoreductase